MNDPNSPCEESQDCCDETLSQAEESQFNLLAYADVPEDVDQVFKAFLDASLLEMANAAKKSKDSKDRPFVYWEAVITFRKEKLGVREEPREMPKGARVQAILEQARQAKPATLQDGLTKYLFWFDVRAFHWSLQLDCDLQELARTVFPSEYLARLAADVSALEKRIEDNVGTKTATPPAQTKPGQPPNLAQQVLDALDNLLQVKRETPKAQTGGK